MVTEGNSNIVISVPGDNGDQARQLGADRPAAVPPGDHRPGARPRPADQQQRHARPTGATPTDAAAPTVRHGRDAAASARQPRPAPPRRRRPASGGAGADRGRPRTPRAVTQEQATADVRDAHLRHARRPATVDRPDDYVAACSEDGTAKYLLGPAVVEGTDVTDANAGTRPTTGEWIVQLDFNNAGSATWAEYTTANVGKQTAFTLDGQGAVRPVHQGAITANTRGHRHLQQGGVNPLAASLKFGSLPVSFTHVCSTSAPSWARVAPGGADRRRYRAALVVIYF